MSQTIQYRGGALVKPAVEIRRDFQLMAGGFRWVRDTTDAPNPLLSLLNDWQAQCERAAFLFNNEYVQPNVICYARLAKAMSIDTIGNRNTRFREVVNFWFDIWNGSSE